jgi:hypothetical protein
LGGQIYLFNKKPHLVMRFGLFCATERYLDLALHEIRANGFAGLLRRVHSGRPMIAINLNRRWARFGPVVYMENNVDP